MLSFLRKTLFVLIASSIVSLVPLQMLHIGEQDDLAEKMPDKVSQMKSELQVWEISGR